MRLITDIETYNIVVLWTHGFSLSQINNGMNVWDATIQRVIRNYMPRHRSDMSTAERQTLLDELKKSAFNSLPDWCFVALELKPKNKKRR